MSFAGHMSHQSFKPLSPFLAKGAEFTSDRGSSRLYVAGDWTPNIAEGCVHLKCYHKILQKKGVIVDSSKHMDAPTI